MDTGGLKDRYRRLPDEELIDLYRSGDLTAEAEAVLATVLHERGIIAEELLLEPADQEPEPEFSIPDGSEVLSVRLVFSEAFAAITKARSSALIWTAATAFVQFLLGAMLSNDLLMGKAFHASDGIVVSLSLFVQSWIWSSIVGNALSVVRGNQVQTLNSIVPLAMVLQILAVGLVALIPIVVGCLFLLFPGIYLGLTWSQSAPLILDGRARGLDSLKISARLTKGVRGKLFVPLLMVGVLVLPASVLDRVAEQTNALTGTLGGIVLVASWLWQILVGVFGVYVLVVLYQKLLARQSNSDA